LVLDLAEFISRIGTRVQAWRTAVTAVRLRTLPALYGAL
jgi:hypothetical protein